MLNILQQGQFGRRNMASVNDASLLDAYSSGMTVCCSMRRRLSSYTGNLIRVRNSNTNVETDIGMLSDGSLNAAAVATACGAFDGYLVRMYYQDGSGGSFANGTAANQPLVYTGGAVIDPTFDGVNDHLSSSANCGAANAVSAFIGGTRTNKGGGALHVLLENGNGTAANQNTFYYDENITRLVMYVAEGANYAQTKNITDFPGVMGYIADRSQSAAADKAKVYKDGALITPATTDVVGTVGAGSLITVGLWYFGIRFNGGAFPFKGTAHTIVIYEASKLADVAAISAAIAVR